MLGWMLIFASMLLCGTVTAVVRVESVVGLTLSLVFGFLLLLGGITQLLRGHA